MNIRKGKLSDIEQLLKILNSSPELQANQNEKFYTKNFVKGAINSKDRSIVLIAEDKSRIVGFLIAEIDKDKQYGFINDIFVKKIYRNKGIASYLEKEYENYCKKLKLSSFGSLVLLTNKKMQEWYKKRGLKKGNKFYYYEKKL